MEKRKDNVDKDYLISEYIDKNKTVIEICESTGLSKGAIEGRLRKYKIYKDKDKIQLSKENRNLSKIGVKNVFELDNVKSKIKETNKIKYGFEHPMSNENIQNKHYNTMLKRYNCKVPIQCNDIKNKIIKTRYENSTQVLKNKNDALRIIKENKLEGKTIKEFSDILGLSYTRTVYYVNKFNLHDILKTTEKTSYYEDDICKYLYEAGITNIIRNDRSKLDGKEIDIYLPDYNIGIEFNGDFWHSIKYKDKDFHMKKSELAISKGIFIYNIFEFEWIKDSTKIINDFINILHTNAECSEECIEIDLAKENPIPFLNSGYEITEKIYPKKLKSARFEIYSCGKYKLNKKRRN